MGEGALVLEIAFMRVLSSMLTIMVSKTRGYGGVTNNLKSGIHILGW